MEKHTLEPIYDKHSKILVLGSFPSIKSREVGFYYSHPKNRFWEVLGVVFQDTLPVTINEKKAFLKKHHLALYDVCASCDIKGSSDASIKNVIPNHLDSIFLAAPIKVIFFNGKTAYHLYQKFFQNQYSVPFLCLPSTSPANAKCKFDDLVSVYQVLNKY